MVLDQRLTGVKAKDLYLITNVKVLYLITNVELWFKD